MHLLNAFSGSALDRTIADLMLSSSRIGDRLPPISVVDDQDLHSHALGGRFIQA